MRFTAILFLLLGVFVVNGQTTKLSVQESAEYKDQAKAKSIEAIHTTEDGITGVVREAKRDLIFDIFDANLDRIFNEVIKIEKKERFVGELYSDEKIKFFTVYSPKKTERILYCHVFDLRNKKLSKVKLLETEVERKQLLFSMQNKRQTSFAISPNGNYFAVSTDNIRKNSNSYDIRVFDAQSLKLIHKKTYQEYEKKFYQHNDLSVDNDGTVFALGKLFEDGKKQKKGGDANYSFLLNKISESDSKVISIDLDEEEHIRSLNISIIDNQLHLLGFYSDSRVGNIKGGCNFVVDSKRLSVSSKKTYELPAQVYQDLYGEERAKRKKKKGKELKRFYVDYVLNDDEDNTYILAEEFYFVSRYVSTGMNGAGYWIQEPHYDDILIFKFDAQGKLGWGRSIFKRSIVPSYNAFIKNDELHVILNSGKNLKEKDDGRTKVSQGIFESSSLYDIVFSKNGDVSYDKIQDNKGNTTYAPFYGTFKNGKFIMSSATGGKRNQFMVLK